MKRLVFGALVSMIISGEVMASSANGLFTPVGFIVLYAMYFVYFSVVDTYRARFSPTLWQLIMFNFALYSVLITGLLHGELLNFIKPGEFIITALIRIQASLFILFTFPIVDAVAPDRRKKAEVKIPLIIFTVYFLLLSPSGKIGFLTFVETVKAAPAVSFAFTLAAGAALSYSLRKTKPVKVLYPARPWLFITFLIALVPFIPVYLFYTLFMIIITLYTLRKNYPYT